MADGKTISVRIETVQGKNTGGKKLISELEREVKESQRRIDASTRAADRAILASKKATVDAEIREIKRLEREQKRAANEFITSLNKVKTSQGGIGVAGVGIGSFLGNVGANAFSRLAAEATDAGRAVFDFSSKMEQSKIAFASLMGNARLAADHLKELQKLTTDFPLEFTSLAKMSQRLQGAGIEAKKIIPLIKDIGNIAAATGDLGAERMEGLGTALSQIASKGRVSAEEMEQLAERGVPAWRILSEAIGKTAAETRKMAEDGEITSNQLFAAFQKFSRMNFGDAMQRQANTFGGAMQQIKNVLLITASTAFEPLYKEISQIAVKANKQIQQQKGDFARIGQTIGEAVGQAMGLAIRAAFMDIAVKPLWAPKSSVFWSSLLGFGGGVASGAYSGLPGSPSSTANRAIDYSRPQDMRRSVGVSPGTLAGAGMMPKTKSAAVKLFTLKDEFSDALNIVAKYGGTVTSTNDGRHNTGSAHGRNEAFDIRTTGINPTVTDAMIRDLRAAGYYVKDERVHPAGQKVWSAPHVHVGRRISGGAIAGTARGSVLNVTPGDVAQTVAAAMAQESERVSQQTRFDSVNRVLELWRIAGILPSPEMMQAIKERMSAYAQATGQNANIPDWMVQNVLMGRRTSTSLTTDLSGANNLPGVLARPLEIVPPDPYVEAETERLKKYYSELREEQQRYFDDTAYFFENTLDRLISGDFKGLFRTLLDEIKQSFIRPLSQMLAGLFTGQGGGQSGGFGSIFGNIFGGGGGIGGTPNFNPNSGGIGGLFKKLFGGGGTSMGFGVGQMPTGAGAGPIGFGSGGTGASGLGSLFSGGAMAGMASAAGVSLALGALTSKSRKDDWMAGLLGVTIGWIRSLFSGDNATKKLKEAALSTYGITVKDKSVLKSLKQLGETMFGKGKVGANAQAVVSSDDGMLILRNYAEASGQSTKKFDALNIRDENWSGNQFRTGFTGKGFAGGRMNGGFVRQGYSYLVGERGTERFVPSTNGHIQANNNGFSNDGRLNVILGQMEETMNMFASRLECMSPGDVVRLGAKDATREVFGAVQTEMTNDLRASSTFHRVSGTY